MYLFRKLPLTALITLSSASAQVFAETPPPYNSVATPQSVLRTSPLPYQGQSEAFSISPAVRDLKPSLTTGGRHNRFKNYVELWERENDAELNEIVPGAGAGRGGVPFVDPLLAFSVHFAPLAMPSPSLTFDGVTSADRQAVFGNRTMPPDTNGDVGPIHFVSTVNGPVGIYTKATGVLAVPLFKMSSLFANFPADNVCRTNDNGDPVVIYDALADRWILSQFAFVSQTAAPWFECIAVSKTSDPTGQYYSYAFRTPDVGTFPDFPKLGVWSDAYYMTDHQNGFLAPPGAAGGGTGFFAFDRAKMLVGDPTATFIYINRPTPGEGGILPSDISGISPPPVGASQLLFRYTADEFGGAFTDAILPYEYIPNFTTPGASVLNVLAPIPVAAFDARQPANRADIEQPAPAVANQNLDSLNDRAVFQTAYHNLGTQAAPINSYTITWGVNVSGAPAGTLIATTFTSGVRWNEVRRDALGVLTLRDQGTQAAAVVDGVTGTNLFMPQIAQDHLGNIAVGYSASGSTTFPSILWAGRTGTSPGNSLNEGEAVMFAGDGVQLATNSRWGDYSSMSVDPSDSCTFYFHSEYRAAAGNNVATGFDWSTRVGRFQFPTCTPAEKGTLNLTVTNCANGNPVPGALALATGGFMQPTNNLGVASFTVPPGNYTGSATFPNSAPTNSSGTVTNGSVTNLGVCVAGVPALAAQTASLVSESFSPANNVLDPGETVTVNLCVINTGLANTTNLIGTLGAVGSVTAPGGPQAFGVVAAGGAASCKAFTFTVDPALACGASVLPSLTLVDGATNFGSKNYVLSTGVAQPATTRTVSYAGAPIFVPDNVAAGVNLPLTLTAPGKITDVDFRFDLAPGGVCNATALNADAAMNHTFVGDLVFKLISPLGTTVSVMSRRGNASDNICDMLLNDDGGFPSMSTLLGTTGLTVGGNFAPDSPLSGFDGETGAGAWNLNVADVAGTDTGTMRRFSLIVSSSVSRCANADGLFADGFE